MKVTGNFTQILKTWADKQNINDAELNSHLDMMAGRSFVPANEWRAALDRAYFITDNPSIGFEVGAEVKLSHVGVLGYLVLNSRTLADALQTYVLCERHFYGDHFAKLTETNQSWTISWPDKLGDKNSLFVQVAFAVLVTFMRQRFSNEVHLQSASFTGAMPTDKTVYESFFKCPVTFDSLQPHLSFDTERLFDSPRGQLPEEYHSMRQHQIDAVSSVVLTSDPFLRRFQSALLNHIPDAGAPLASTARELNVSVRTLQRRLNSFGLRYQTTLDAAREQLARRYIRRTSLTMAEIAQLLGYSDQSAFNRAFKSWMGTTPGRFRGKRK